MKSYGWMKEVVKLTFYQVGKSEQQEGKNITQQPQEIKASPKTFEKELP